MGTVEAGRVVNGRLRPLAAAVTLLVLCPAPGAGQEVRFSPRPDRPLERRLDRFLQGEEYRLWTADTTVASGDTIRGNVLVLEGLARIAGRVEGTVFGVDADVFLRPGAEITGDLVLLGGGIYRASSARVGGEVVYEPRLFLQATPERGGWRIYRTDEARLDPVRPDGLGGVRAPSYQRVDGATLGLGARLQAIEVPWQPTLHAILELRTEGLRVGGHGEQLWYPSGRWATGFEGGRRTRTRDAWIRSGGANSLTFLFGGLDYRNYFESDEARFLIRRLLERRGSVELTAGWERFRSLGASEDGDLFGGRPARPNPPIAPGDLWSLSLAVRRPAGELLPRVGVDLEVEAADAGVGGDFSFLYAGARLEAAWPTVAGQRVEALAAARGDLAGTLPPQRGSAVGGAGTLPTLDVLEVRGERLLFTRWTYVVPVPLLRVPGLGSPEVLLRAAVGSAWGGGDPVDLRENLVLGLRFLLLEGGIAFDPSASGGDPTGFLTFQVPR